MAIQYALSESVRPLYIAPVKDGIARPVSEWFPILQDKPGNHERPWWSPDGRTIYYLSDTAGKLNIWARRLNDLDKKPVGEPFLVFAPPAGRYRVFAHPFFGPALGPKSLLFAMTETVSNIYYAE